MHRTASHGYKVLVCAPYGHDAESMARILAQAGYSAQNCDDLNDVAQALDDRTGAVLATDEVLRFDAAKLSHALRSQPPWSDVPFVMLVERSRSPAQGPEWERLQADVRNLVVLERPLGSRSLLSAVAAVLISRQRQFEVRDRIAELREAHDTLEVKVAERTAELHREMESRAQAEAALRQAQKMEAIGQLTGGIAHDFNNMLTGVIGSLDIVRRRIASGRLDGVERFMDAASASAARAASLTQRLLAFSRLQSLDSKPTDINALVGSLEDLLHRTLTERVTLRTVLAHNLPPGVADANQLESAVLNLAINARDAMPNGGVLTVETSEALLDASEARDAGVAPGRYVVVAVSDTGVGMSREVLERVFDPFFTTKPTGQGTGLGLSMVYGFAKQSGGQVRIQSQPGEGTSVRIFLPAAEREAAPATAPTAERVTLGLGERVLIVEDDASVRLLVVSVLEELGYAAVEAADAKEAIHMLESPEPLNLMITDVGLPGLNGRQLAEVARRHRPELPVLFITGYAANAAIRASFLGTNMAMITKPFAVETLSAKIGEMIAARGESRGARQALSAESLGARGAIS